VRPGGVMFDVAKAVSFRTELECVRYLEATIWPDSPRCPRCQSYERSGGVIRLGENARIASAARLYLCKYCRRQFSILTGTMFERTHLPLSKWFKAMHVVFNTPGITVTELQAYLSTSYKTAWYLRAIIRTVPEYEIVDEYRVVEKAPSLPRKQRRWVYGPFLQKI
jgi:transposase-like protein